MMLAPEVSETRYILHRRFDRLGRLVGDPGMEKLFRSRVMIIGLGGVGSWAAESLARSGAGSLVLVDFDEICITNSNRQLHALQGLVGQKKAQVMAERIKKINPQCEVIPLVKFYNEENSAEVLAQKPDYIVDAIDNLTAKAHLLATAKAQGLKIITSGGSAAKLDPLQIKFEDLARTKVDPMAAQLRKILRTKYDFSGEGPFGIPCIYSEETPRNPIELHYDGGQGFKCVCPQGQNDLHSCERRSVIYGNASFVTGAFGLAMASWVVRDILGENK